MAYWILSSFKHIQNLNTMSEETTPLPFPLDGTTNISSIFKYHVVDPGENDTHETKICTKYYFTIPMDKLRPSPCTFSDTAYSCTGEGNRLILIMLFHLMHTMFYGDQPHRKTLPDNKGNRFNVFMEYLLPIGTDINDYTLIDALGIRFHIHIFDTSLDILSGLQRMIEKNGGTPATVHGINDSEGSADGVQPEGRPKKRQKTSQCKKNKIHLFNAYEEIKSIWSWYTIANTASDKRTEESEWTEFCMPDDDSWTPLRDHPFHPLKYFSWESSHVDGMMPCQSESNEIFGVPNAVFYIGEHIRNPLAILGVTLPKTPLWFEQHQTSRMDTLSSLANAKFMEKRMLDDVKYIKRNDLKEIKAVQKQRMETLINRTDCSDIAMKMREFRERSVKYIAGVWRPGAFVSKPIHTLSTKAVELKTWTTDGGLQIVDPHMSSFGNFMAQMLIDFENVLRISTTHTILLRVIINSLDAYRQKADLHNNTVLLGGGSVGKSHILDSLAQLFEDTTVSKITHVTEKASAIDTDNNDHISCYHEMPGQLLGQEKGGQEQGSHIIKDQMTSCSVETQTIHVDSDTGRRHSARCTSECIGVFIMVTNERWDKVPQALSTRMIPITVNDSRRTKFGINEMTCKISGVMGGTYSNDEYNHLFYSRWRKRQNVLVMVEKMIYTHVLEDVGMGVFDTMQINITENMIKSGIMYNDGNIRDIKFLRHFARTLTLLHAVEKFINDTESPGYKCQQFGTLASFKCLQQIQPYLFCTEEIALFTLTVNADQLIKVNHFKVVELILSAADKFFLKDGDVFQDHDGYFRTHGKFRDYTSVYNLLEKNQGKFRERISRQNIIVTFKELQNKGFEYQPIIQYDIGNASIAINKGYVEKHFSMDVGLGRYVCKFDVNTIMVDVFNNAYANTFTKTQDNMLMGTTYDKDIPFLFNTITKKPNPKHVLSRNLAVSTDYDGIDLVEENEYYKRVNDNIRFKINYEDFTYQSYLKDCGYDIGEYDCIKTLYNHNVPTSAAVDKEYPKSYVDLFEKSTGIKAAK